MKVVLNFTPTSRQIMNIISNPQLYRLHSGSEEGLSTVTIDGGLRYIAGHVDGEDEPFGLFTLKVMSDKIVDGHIWILPEYWGKDVSRPFLELGLRYLKECTKINIVTTFSPDPCKNAQHLVEEFGFKKYHTHKNGATYGDRVVDLHYYELYLER